MTGIGVKPSPLRPPPTKSKVIRNPANAYRMIDGFAGSVNLTVKEFLWRFYFTIDKLFSPIDAGKYSSGCSIDRVSCFVPKYSQFKEDDHDEVRVYEVPAGKWISRFLSDSQYGDNVLCHTLQSNVTVDFTRCTDLLILTIRTMIKYEPLGVLVAVCS